MHPAECCISKLPKKECLLPKVWLYDHKMYVMPPGALSKQDDAHESAMNCVLLPYITVVLDWCYTVTGFALY